MNKGMSIYRLNAVTPNVVEVTELPNTERGTNGHGSTCA